jgi:hypothetical protein
MGIMHLASKGLERHMFYAPCNPARCTLQLMPLQQLDQSLSAISPKLDRNMRTQ